jgi:hypothetical protein
MKIGVVGFSRSSFDKKTAILKLRNILESLVEGKNPKEIEIVSGYTNMGVPRIAYRLADDMGLVTVGFSAQQALRVRAGVYPVQKKILVGERFGDESEAFIEYIDILIRIGGGPQSRHETALFKQRYADQDLSQILFEEEVDWYGK